MSSAAGRVLQIWGDESFVPFVPKIVGSCLQGELITLLRPRTREDAQKRCAKLLFPDERPTLPSIIRETPFR